MIERDGLDHKTGEPVAFIEVAWRRYTKHSKNKAQEIQGAVLPLAEKYQWNTPFLGVVLAGEFTIGSIDQLKSLGFHVLYFPYETLIDAFSAEGFQIRFDEKTPDREFKRVVDILQAASEETMGKIKQRLIALNQQQIQEFLDTLDERLGRRVSKIVILPLYGRTNEFASLEGAIDFLNQHPIYEGSGSFRKYEVQVTFSNGDKAQGEFNTKQKTHDFLMFVANQ